MTIKAYKAVKLGLIKDGKCGATAPRALRIKRALAWVTIQHVN
jgi:hypothetical protein